MKVYLYTDGGARGNPGPGAAGVVLKDEKGKTIKKVGTYLGVCTNNEAEYKALILGLKTAKKEGATQIESYVDSMLVAKQLNGEYKVKDLKMRKLWNKIKELEKSFKRISYRHVKREKNTDADSLVNEVLDAA